MIVVTGASGRTGKRVAEGLLAKGKSVRVIGRDARKLVPLVALGAEPTVGAIDDVSQLSSFFGGAEAVYLVPPEDPSQPDMRAHQERISGSYAAAVENARVPFAVNLSSIGGQHSAGTGPIVGLRTHSTSVDSIERKRAAAFTSRTSTRS